MKVTLKVDCSDNLAYGPQLEVLVDNESIGIGSYGGEPEDNSRYRDYSWIEPLIIKLAEKLGAEVELVEKLKCTLGEIQGH